MKNKYKAKVLNIRCLFYDICKWLGFPMFFWYRVRKIYENDNAKKKIKGGCLLVSNHVGYNDIMVLHTAFWYRRLHFTAMKELFASSFRRLLFKGFLCTEVDRENFSMKSFTTIVEKLKGGNVVTIFPEGKISKTTSSFKSGATLMAIKGNAYIVPTYREKRKHFWNREKIVVGEPIYFENKNYSKDDVDQITIKIQEKMSDLERIYKSYEK